MLRVPYIGPRMRSLFILALGGFCGVIATVLFFSLDTTFESDPDVNSGGGNARLVFDETGLEALIKKEIATLEGFSQISSVKVTVEEQGVLRIEVSVGGPQVGLSGDLIADPNVVDGRLQVDVVSAGVGGLGVPAAIAQLIEAKLQQSLDALDPDLEYRLVSITTTNHQLALELSI